MRAVALRLDVHPNALYSYVSTKDDLVISLLDDVLEQATKPPAQSRDPIEAVFDIFMATYDSLCQHSDLIPAFLAYRGVDGPNATELAKQCLELFHAADFDSVFAEKVLQSLITYTIGTAAFDVTGSEKYENSTVADGLRLLLLGAKNQTDNETQISH